MNLQKWLKYIKKSHSLVDKNKKYITPKKIKKKRKPSSWLMMSPRDINYNSKHSKTVLKSFEENCFTNSHNATHRSMTHLAYRCYFKAGKIIKEEKHSEVWIGSTPTLLIFTTSNVMSFFSHSLHMFVNPIYISYTIYISFIYCRQKLHKGALPQPQHLALNLQWLHERALQRDVHSNRGGTRTSHEEL